MACIGILNYRIEKLWTRNMGWKGCECAETLTITCVIPFQKRRKRRNAEEMWCSELNILCSPPPPSICPSPSYHHTYAKIPTLFDNILLNVKEMEKRGWKYGAELWAYIYSITIFDFRFFGSPPSITHMCSNVRPFAYIFYNSIIEVF